MRRPSGNDSNALLTRATNFWGRPLGAAESLTAPHFQGDTAPRGSNGSRCDSVGTRCCLPPTASSRDVHRAEADAVSGSAPQMKPRSSRGSEQPRDRGGQAVAWHGHTAVHPRRQHRRAPVRAGARGHGAREPRRAAGPRESRLLRILAAELPDDGINKALNQKFSGLIQSIYWVPEMYPSRSHVLRIKR